MKTGFRLSAVEAVQGFPEFVDTAQNAASGFVESSWPNNRVISIAATNETGILLCKKTFS